MYRFMVFFVPVDIEAQKSCLGISLCSFLESIVFLVAFFMSPHLLNVSLRQQTRNNVGIIYEEERQNYYNIVNPFCQLNSLKKCK